MRWKVERLEAEMPALLGRLSKSYQGLMVACSGGLDSTALLHLFWRFTKSQKNFRLGLIHVNYGLRGEDSKGDQIFVENLAKAYGIKPRIIEISPAQRDARHGEGVQEWARRLRREAFEAAIADGYAVALGHHLDDLAETALMRLCRGSSIGNLAGMKFEAPPIYRPWLYVARADIEAYARTHGLYFRLDASNAGDAYSRNRLRHHVLPALEALYPGASARIAATALEGADMAAYCRTHLNTDLPSLKNAAIDVEALRRLPRGVALEGLAALIGMTPGLSKLRHLSRRFLGGVLDRLESATADQTWSLNLPGLGDIAFDGTQLRVFRPTSRRKELRREQYASLLARDSWQLILEPSASVAVPSLASELSVRQDGASASQTTLRITNHQGLSSTPIRVYVPNPGEKLRFHSESRSWLVKELQRVWGLNQTIAGSGFVVGEGEDIAVLGMFDGERLVSPGPLKEKKDCGKLKLCLE